MNKGPVPDRVLTFVRHIPGDLPDDLLPDDEEWHPATLRWWSFWRDSPLTADLSGVDWAELEATAVLHHQFMRKRTFSLGSELRLRMALFGATPADRARLRIIIADADVKDATRPTPESRKKYSGLKVVADEAVGE